MPVWAIPLSLKPSPVTRPDPLVRTDRHTSTLYSCTTSMRIWDTFMYTYFSSHVLHPPTFWWENEISFASASDQLHPFVCCACTYTSATAHFNYSPHLVLRALQGSVSATLKYASHASSTTALILNIYTKHLRPCRTSQLGEQQCTHNRPHIL